MGGNEKILKYAIPLKNSDCKRKTDENLGPVVLVGAKRLLVCWLLLEKGQADRRGPWASCFLLIYNQSIQGHAMQGQ